MLTAELAAQHRLPVCTEDLSRLPDLLEPLLQQLESGAGGPEDSLQLVERACILVQEQFSDSSLSAARLAEELELSAMQLGRMFKKHLQQTIPEYINHIRLDNAIQWL